MLQAKQVGVVSKSSNKIHLLAEPCIFSNESSKADRPHSNSLMLNAGHNKISSLIKGHHDIKYLFSLIEFFSRHFYF